MKVKIMLQILIALISFLSFSQDRKGQIQNVNSNYPSVLYVSLGLNVEFSTQDYTLELKNFSPEFRLIANQYGIQLNKGVLMSDDKLLQLETNAIKYAGNSNAIKKLKNIFTVQIDNPTNEILYEIGVVLEQLAVVEYCSLVSLEPIKPPSDIPPTTLNYEENQTYIQADPGVNMQYAWDLGLNAQGIRLRDVEYGFNPNHEDIVDVEANLADGMTISSAASQDYTEHGTGVFGILYAHKGNYGVSGLAFGAQELVLFPEWQQSGYNRINAVIQSISNSTEGDVIVYEMQTDGANVSSTDYVLAEYNQVIWDLTKAATDSGITIVAAAGNGNVNLDGSLYTSYMARGDSGAIVVGAGTSTVSHTKLGYSTYGSRVDLQAWGENVQTIGKLSLLSHFLVGNDFNQSYQIFTGTSSATPIVASCAAVLQSYYHSLFQQMYLTSQQLRTIMKETGIAQGNSSSGNIGPIPNMQTAIERIYIEYVLSLNDSNGYHFAVLPNPVDDNLTLITSDLVSNDAKIDIFNSLGQLVYSNYLNKNTTINISQLSKGFYLVKVSENNLSFVQKIVKR